MRKITVAGLATVSCCIVTVAGAQRGGGSGGTTRLTDRVEVMYQQAFAQSPTAGRADWMRFVVLWRGQPGWRSAKMTEAEQIDAERERREVEAAATLAKRSVMGNFPKGPRFWAEFDRENNALYVLGNRYAIPSRDSTLVILVDRVDRVGGQPFVVGAAIVDGRMSSEFVRKNWVSGDTSFSVRPAKSALDVFLEGLKKDSGVAAFLQ